MADGPVGASRWLRPEALFGLDGLDPLVHSVFWSLFLNTATLVSVSLLTSQSALERIQATLFVDMFRAAAGSEPHFIRGSATSDDLFFVAERVLGGSAPMPCSSLPVGSAGRLPRPSRHRSSSAGWSANSPARSARPRRM